MPELTVLAAEMDRRRFLALLGSLVAVGALSGCANQISLPSLLPSALPGPGSPGPSPGPLDRYEILRRLQAIIRTSPDHLGSLAAAAVASKDPATIVRFVQD